MNKATLTSVVVGAVFVLPLLGLVSLYQTAFSLWMCAHPVHQSLEWQHRFYLRLATTLVIGLVWLVSLIWIIRQRKEPSQGSGRGN
jgi:hypothetical protein